MTNRKTGRNDFVSAMWKALARSCRGQTDIAVAGNILRFAVACKRVGAKIIYAVDPELAK